MTEDEFSSLPIPVALVVDDEPLIRMDTSDIVADEGYHVIEARTADEAFAFLKQHHSLKLVFTDIQMPGAWMVCSSQAGLENTGPYALSWPRVPSGRSLSEAELDCFGELTKPEFGFPQNAEPHFPSVHHAGASVNGVSADTSPYMEDFLASYSWVVVTQAWKVTLSVTGALLMR